MSAGDRTPTIAPLGERFDDVRRIAVLRGGGLGDLLFALPAVRALSAAYPGAEVTLLGTHAAQSLLAERDGAPDRVDVLPVVPGVGAAPDVDADPGQIDAFLRAQRAREYDLAVQLHGGGRYSNPFLLELAARHTVGTRTPDAADLERTLPYVYYQHEMMRGLEVVGLSGAAPVELEPGLAATAAERAAADAVCGSGPVAAVHPGATDPRRRWPAHRFGRVAAALVEAGARVVVVGDAGDAATCTEVVRAARDLLPDAAARGVVDTAGRLSLSQLVGVLARAEVLVGNDSGPRHLAQALGTRTVGIYWAGNLINAGPLGRSMHRAHLSWTTRCPVCGRDSTQVGWTAPRCEHDVSFVDDVDPDAVRDDAVALLRDGVVSRELSS